MCLDGEKNDRVAFQARADYQNHAIGWLHRGHSSDLAVGKWYEFHEFGWHVDLVKPEFLNQMAVGEARDNWHGCAAWRR